MLGAVGGKAAPGFLQLALATHAFPSPALVPGHGDVDEALEEIPLGRLRRPPGTFESLVGLEEPPFLEQREAALVVGLELRGRP